MLSCSPNPHKPETDLEKIQLKGSVKQVTEILYFIKHNPLSEDKIKYELYAKEITKFNSEGNIIENQLINLALPDSLSYLNSTNRTIYKYDKDGYLLYFYNTIDSSREKRYSYDKKGNLLKVQWYLNSNPIEDKSEYKYDLKNLLIEETEWDTSSTPKSKETYDYDERGQKTESSLYRRNKSGQLQFSHKNLFKYDSSGSIIEVISFYRNDLSTRIEYKYDSFRNNTLTTHFDKYDKIANLDSNIYQYDHRNNWIKKTNYSTTLPLYLEPKPSEIIQRIIEYY